MPENPIVDSCRQHRRSDENTVLLLKMYLSQQPALVTERRQLIIQKLVRSIKNSYQAVKRHELNAEVLGRIAAQDGDEI